MPDAARKTSGACPFYQGGQCRAMDEPKWPSVDHQARYCLTVSHTGCRRYREAVASEGASPSRPGRDGKRVAVALAAVLVVGAVVAGLVTMRPGNAFVGTLVNRGESASSVAADERVEATPLAIGGPAVMPPEPAQGMTAEASPTASPNPTPAAAPAASPPAAVAPSPSPTAMAPEVAPRLPLSHRVASGETLGAIAARYGVDVALVVAANPGINPDQLAPGLEVFIPAPDGRLPETAPLTGVYRVAEGDTLSAIAERFGVAVDAIADANAIADPTHLEVGWILVIPKAGEIVTPVVPAAAPATTHTVVEGETLYAIATQYGVTVDALMAANGLTDRAYLEVGWVLVIPATS